MPSELLVPTAQARPELISWLKDKDNPFDLFVAPRHADEEGLRHHVPGVHRTIFDTLQAVLERYRPSNLARVSDIPRSGVVVVLGSRGAGKTHLLHALQQGKAGGGAVIVAPSVCEPNRPFTEYLLHQLVRHLQDETADRSSGTLDLLASALTYKVLAQALHGMTETDWLGHNVSSRFQFWQYLLGIGTRPVSDRKRALIQDLNQPEARPLPELGEAHEQDLETLRRITLLQIERAESGLTIAAQIRRGLYLELARRAFGGPLEALFEFLLDGYTRVEASTSPSRATLVEELFRALLELCLLARLPVVFAFDALETLLGDPPEERVCHQFFKGLADALDGHRGIPFLFFAEVGHWQQVRRYQSDYVQQRLQQGIVRVPGHGSLSSLSIPPVSAADLRALVEARMKPLLADSQEPDQEDASIQPFQEEDLQRIARGAGQGPPVRQALQALRDRYEEIVAGKKATRAIQLESSGKVMEVERSPKRDRSMVIEKLEEIWKREERAAIRRLENGSPNTLSDEIHGGVLQWCRCLLAEGTTTNQGTLAAAEIVTFGAHPTYGQMVQCSWSKDSDQRQLGVGLLLGQLRGMARDLETKLELMNAEDCPVQALVLLWRRDGATAGAVHEQLPKATREIWDRFPRATARVTLKAIKAEHLAVWLALPKWLNTARTEIEGVTDAAVHHFVKEHTLALIDLVLPRS